MTAGLNLCARVWDFRYDLGEQDDETGGSQPSGTILQDRVEMRISSNKPTQALLEQGVESIDLYDGVIGNHTINILNNHEVEVTAPANSPFYGEFFRVLGNPQRSSMSPSDSRSFLYVSLKRVERSRSIQ